MIEKQSSNELWEDSVPISRVGGHVKGDEAQPPLALGGKGFQSWRGSSACAQSEDLSDLLPGPPGHPQPERADSAGK